MPNGTLKKPKDLLFTVKRGAAFAAPLFYVQVSRVQGLGSGKNLEYRTQKTERRRKIRIYMIKTNGCESPSLPVMAWQASG